MINDTAVHEIDLVRWMFGEEIVATRVLKPRRSRNGGDLQDPLVLLLETAAGILVDVEISVNIRYGYDIRGEVVCEDGTAELDEPSPVRVRRAGRPPTGCRRTGGSASSGRTTSSCRSGSTRSAATASSARAPGTATRRRWSPTPACGRCAPASGCRCRSCDRPALYEK